MQDGEMFLDVHNTYATVRHSILTCCLAHLLLLLGDGGDGLDGLFSYF